MTAVVLFNCRGGRGFIAGDDLKCMILRLCVTTKVLLLSVGFVTAGNSNLPWDPGSQGEPTQMHSEAVNTQETAKASYA